MNYLFLFLVAKFLPFVNTYAIGTIETDLETDAGLGGTMNKWVKTGASVGAGVIAFILIIAIIKNVVQYAKGGNGSIAKIVGMILFLILMIGVIVFVQNYESLGATGANLAKKAVDTGDNWTNDLLNQVVTGTPSTGGSK